MASKELNARNPDGIIVLPFSSWTRVGGCDPSVAGARTLLMPKMKVSFAEFDRLLALRSDAHAVCPASLELHGLTAGYYEAGFFVGGHAGYVYRRGGLGLGYYADPPVCEASTAVGGRPCGDVVMVFVRSAGAVRAVQCGRYCTVGGVAAALQLCATVSLQ